MGGGGASGGRIDREEVYVFSLGFGQAGLVEPFKVRLRLSGL